VLSLLQYLHENGVVHRDLKPENLLYADLSIDAPLKIADFGLSKIIDEQVTMKTVCGTPGYCAPEILRGNAYGPEVDMWSVGVILYILEKPGGQPHSYSVLRRGLIEPGKGYTSRKADDCVLASLNLSTTISTAVLNSPEGHQGGQLYMTP
ncbi:Calcium/calmodulin-dependent protein kinase type IV, partial [Anabarilius grahami]